MLGERDNHYTTETVAAEATKIAMPLFHQLARQFITASITLSYCQSSQDFLQVLIPNLYNVLHGI